MKDWILEQIKTYRKRQLKAWDEGELNMHSFYHGCESAYTEMLKKLIDEEIEHEKE